MCLLVLSTKIGCCNGYELPLLERAVVWQTLCDHTFEGFVYIPRHTCVKCTFIIVQLKGNAPISFSFLVNCDVVPTFQYFLEMVDTVIAFGLDDEIA